MTEVLNSHYIDIVDRFEIKIYNSLNPEKKDEIGKNHKRVWELAGNYLETSEIFKEYFPKVGSSHVAVDHLTRKIKQYKAEKYIPFKPLYLINILKFLDYDFPSNLTKADINTDEKRANELYSVYILDTEGIDSEKLKIISEIDAYRAWVNNAKLENAETNDKHIEVEQKDQLENDDVDTATYISKLIEDLRKKDEKEVLEMIKRFLNHLEKNEFNEAADCDLTILENEDANDEVNLKLYFEYYNVVKIVNLNMWDFEIIKQENQMTGAFCKIYYEEYVVNFTSNLLEEIFEARTSGIEEFSSKHKSLSKEFNKFNIGIDQMPINIYFDDNFSKLMFMLLNRSKKRIEEVLPMRKVQKFVRLKSVVSVRVNDKWYIGSIEDIPLKETISDDLDV